MKNILFILFVSVFVLKKPIYGQNKTMDSLNLALKNAKHDTIKLNTYEKLIEFCEMEDNLKYATPAVNLTDLILNKTYDLSKRKRVLKNKEVFINSIIFYYQQKNNYPEIIKNLKKAYYISVELKDTANAEQNYANITGYDFKVGNSAACMDSLISKLKYYENKGLKKWVAFYLTETGRAYERSSNYTKALEYFEKALILYMELNNEQEIASLNTIIAEGYIYLEKKEKSIEHYFKALKIIEKKGNLRKVYNTLYGITDCYIHFNDTTNAFIYQAKCFKIAEETNDTMAMGTSLRHLSKIYVRQKNYKQALIFALKSVDYFKKIGFKEMIFGGLRTVVGICNYDKKYDLALKFALEAKKVAIDDDNIYSISNINYVLFEIYQNLGNSSEALKHHINYVTMKDSIEKIENKAELNQKSMKYEFDKNELETKAIQEKKDIVDKEEKQQQRIIIYSVSAGLFLVLLLVLFVFRGLKQKQKDNAIITLQKNEVEKSKHIIEEKHKEITDSINYAERIQRTFLATNDLLNQQLKNYFILFKPKDVVSGDFYWADTLPNGNFILATADSTGHGVPGAIMSLLNITSLEKAIEHLTDPAEILNHTRQTIIKRLKKDGSAEGGKDGMDCSLIVFDFKNKQLHVSAAHNPVWIVRENNLIEIKADKMPVGKHDRDQESFTSHTIDIKADDTIYTLTDGFPDQFGGEKGKKFMSKNLKELLIANTHLPMQEQKELLHKTFTNWVGNLEQVDDVTLIGIKI